MPTKREQVRLVRDSSDTRLGAHCLPKAIKEHFDLQSHQAAYALIWELVAERLAYIDMTERATENQALYLTESGRELAAGREPDPRDPSGYLTSLRAIPGIDSLTMTYAEEALRAYESNCPLATNVLVGVASEQMMLLLGDALADALKSANERQKLKKVLDSKQHFVHKFDAIKKRLEVRKNDVPDKYGSTLALDLTTTADLIRVDRNDAGHPTGRSFTNGDAFATLTIFARHAERTLGLREWLIANPASL